MDKDQAMLDEPLDDIATPHSRLYSRLLVAGLLLSFMAVVAAFWLSGTLVSAPQYLLPLSFLRLLAAHRVPVIMLPAFCLVVCYITLRSLTGETMTIPERYLDERQKMIRDQAHRSAFKVLRAACVLVPLLIILVNTPSWLHLTPPPFVQAAIQPLVKQAQQVQQTHTSIIKFASPSGKTNLTMPATIQSNAAGKGIYAFIAQSPGNPKFQMGKLQLFQVVIAHPTTSMILPAQQPATSLEITLGLVVLFISLLCTIWALPMSVLAWKGTR